MQVGIIGYGRFGKLWASLCASHADVVVFDPRVQAVSTQTDDRICFVSIAEVCQSDVVFLCVPIAVLKEVARSVASLVRPGTIVCDVASVKVLPMQWMQEVFGSAQPLVFTHPLFGPDSVSRTGIAGKKMVIATQSDESARAVVAVLCTHIGLQVLYTTADEHDIQMAKSQALVHFIGRGLAPLSLLAQEIATPDYERLLAMIDLVSHDTMELFVDMQRFNPHASVIREHFLQSVTDLGDMLRAQTG